jgi:hypothetical protein
MTISDGEIHVREVIFLKPGDIELPQTAVLFSFPGGSPDGIVSKHINYIIIDMHGTVIQPGGAVVACKFNKTIIALFNAFYCAHCKETFSVKRMEREIPDADVSTHGIHSMRQGICGDCWKSNRSRRIWSAIGRGSLGVLRCIAAPFITPTNGSPPSPSTYTGTRGGLGISIVLALSLLGGASGAANGARGIEGSAVKQEVAMSSHNNQTIMKEIVALLEKATLLGVDNRSMYPVGARMIRNIQVGLQTGNMPEYDVSALSNIVARLERTTMPMEWRLAFAKNPPPDIITPGEIHPFKLLDGTPVGLSFVEMTEAIRCTGRSGSSKTTGACAILDACIAAGKSVFICDQKGQGQLDYLCRKYPGRVLKIRIGQPDRPFFNPWQWVQVIRDIFLVVTGRRDSRVVIDTAIEDGLKRNALSGACELTHSQLMRIINEGKTPADFPKKIRPDFFQSMHGVFFDLARSPLSRQIACQRGYDLREIVSKRLSLIVDTAAIAGSQQEEFLICGLLAALRQEIINDPILGTSSGTQVVFFLDEGTGICAASKVPGSLPSLVLQSTLVRSSSICLFPLYHSMSIVHPVLNAAGMFLVCQILDGNDIFTAKRTFALTDQQAKALTDLPKGVAMMRMGNRYTEPFLVTYPRIPDAVKMTDAEADANNSPILANLPPIVPEDYRKVPVRVVTPVVTPSAASVPAATSATKFVGAKDLSVVTSDYTAILNDIARSPFLNVSKRAAQLALPSGKTLTYKELKPVLDELKSQGYLDEQAVSLAPRAGAPSLLHFLTAEGHAAIGSLYKPERGDYRHDFIQRLVKHVLSEKGVKAAIEAGLPGTSKVVDLGVILAATKQLVAIEIPLSTFSTEPDQAKRDLEAGWTDVIEVCLSKVDLARLEREFLAACPLPDPRIRLCSLSSIVAVASLSEITKSTGLVFKHSK